MYSNNLDPGYGSQYGLVGNCQNCDIQDFFGVSMGCYRWRLKSLVLIGHIVHDSICKNQSRLYSCDMHGNTENCTVNNVNCFVGGISLAGHNNKHRNINIYLGSSQTDSTAYIAILQER